MKDDNIENLYQKSKTDKSPKYLDNFILAQAKNSCDEKQEPTSLRSSNKWLFNLSTAAVVLLSFSIIFNLQNENAHIPDQSMMLERSSTEKNIYKENKDSSSKKSSNKITNDGVPESPNVVFDNVESEAKPDEVYESADTQTPTVSGLSMQETNLEINASNKVETKSVATPLPKAIAPVPKKTMDDISIKEEEQSLIIQAPKSTQSIEKELQNSDYSTQNDDSENLDKITVTGSRLMSKPIDNVEDTFKREKENKKELSFAQKLEKLDALIENKKLEEAKQKLMQLKKAYPYYNFSKYKELLK